MVSVLGKAGAVASIFTGVYIRNELQALRELEGVRREVESNRGTATDIVVDLGKDIDSMLAGEEKYTRSTSELSVSAYNSIRDAGSLSRFSDELSSKLRKHHQEIQLINNELRNRGKHKITEESPKNEVTRDKDDMGTVIDLLQNCSNEHVNEIENMLSDNSEFRTELQKFRELENTPLLQQQEREDPRGNFDFDTVEAFLEEELNPHCISQCFYK